MARPPVAVGAWLVVTAIVSAACGPTAPTAPPSPSAAPPSVSPSASVAATPVADPSTVYRTIEDQVVAIRGLQPKAPVTPKILDEPALKVHINESFRKDNPPELMAANERILKAFGLIPADASLTDLYISLLGSSVAGLYNPDDKQLYVVSKSGGLGAAEKTTFSHEFTHALQDQTFGIGGLRLDEVGQGDRSFARLTLLEGDATLVMSNWQIKHLTAAELGEILAGSADDESLKILLAMPPILRESLLFPYTMGLGFVQGLQATGGWAAVDGAYADPPASTEQILHPDKYLGHESPVPVEIPRTLASGLGSGWTVGLEDSFGEFQMQVWLKQNAAIDSATALDAAAGWGGDRIAVLNGPNGAWSVVLRTMWDTDADASAFEAAASGYVEQLASPAGLIPGTGRERWILIASDQDTLRLVTSTLGLGG